MNDSYYGKAKSGKEQDRTYSPVFTDVSVAVVTIVAEAIDGSIIV